MDERTKTKVKALMKEAYEQLQKGNEEKAKALVDAVINEIGYVPNE